MESLWLHIHNLWENEWYFLCGGRGEWWWGCSSDRNKDIGPFPSRKEAIAFGQSKGSIV